MKRDFILTLKHKPSVVYVHSYCSGRCSHSSESSNRASQTVKYSKQSAVHVLRTLLASHAACNFGLQFQQTLNVWDGLIVIELHISVFSHEEYQDSAREIECNS